MFLPFRNLSTRGSLLAVGVCVVLGGKSMGECRLVRTCGNTKD